MAACIAFLIWQFFFARAPVPPAVTENENTQSAPTVAQAEPVPVQTMTSLEVRGADQEQVVELGNGADIPDSPYRMHLRLDNRGASIESAWLTDYSATLHSDDRYQVLRPVQAADHPALFAFTTEKVNLGGDNTYLLDDVLWQSRTEKTEQGEQAIFWVDLLHEEQPIARITKTYTLAPQALVSGHYDLNVSLTMENLSSDSIKFIVTQRGPTGLLSEDPRMDDRQVLVGLQNGPSVSVVPHALPALLKANQPKSLFDPGSAPLDWVSLANKYFAVIIAPEGNTAERTWIASAVAERLTTIKDEKNDLTIRLVTLPISVEPGHKTTQKFDCFVGPKSKKVFTREPAYLTRNYVQLIVKDYYWCAFAPVVAVMIWIFDVCHKLIPNYGFALIVLVLIVRVILHPLTKKGQVSMTKMTKEMSVLQPRIDEIRRKYPTDKQKQNQETMKLYQELGVNPAGQMMSCLPMMCQMPVWAALYAMLNFTIELRHQPFILWIKDLTAPDMFYTFASSYPLIGNHLNLIPPLLGISMWLQQKYMPKPATAARRDTKTGNQMAQQKMMMNFMSVFMIFIFYNMPSGLTLYIMASNFFGLFEQRLIRKHIEKLDQAKTATGVPSSAAPTDKAPLLRKPKFLQKLQKMAEDARRR